jgi:hypothetical protein
MIIVFVKVLILAVLLGIARDGTKQAQGESFDFHNFP